MTLTGIVENLHNVALTIAGSDSSGGAGIQADLKTFAAHGCYGASVLTALTAQNTRGVQSVHPVPPEFVEQQMQSVLSDLDIGAIKTGMLYDATIIRTIVQMLKSHYQSQSPGKGMPPVVCDPVCISTSGHTLLQADALDALITDLLPISTLVTPNKSEAELLLSRRTAHSKLLSLEDMLQAAEELINLRNDNSDVNDSQAGCAAVLLKGGHLIVSLADVQRVKISNPEVKVVKQLLLEDNMEILMKSQKYDTSQLVVDVLCQKEGRKKVIFVRPRIESKSTHGTGCTLSSAIASELARGTDLEKAVEKATLYTHFGIQAASHIGHGHGPLNHLHNISFKLIPQPSTTNYFPFTRLLIESTAQSWKGYVEHDFVVQLGKGTLDKKNFVHFVRQDYIYLKYYARAYGLLAAKSTSFPVIATSTQNILNILQEIENHRSFCAKFVGIPEEDLDTTPEASATTAYGTYLIDMGLQGDTSKLTMALMACLLGYGEVGLWLKKQSEMTNSWVVLKGNPYRQWMDEYAGEAYQNAVKIGLDAIETMVMVDPPSEARFSEWRSIWERCIKLETAFWDMAMELRN